MESTGCEAQSIRTSRLNRHILVIGGAGYVGSVLIRKLMSSGYKVRVLDKLIHNHGSSIAGLLEFPNFSFLNGDFCEKAILSAALKDITDIVLMAAIVGDPFCKKYPDLAIKTNQEGSIQLFDRLAGKGIDRFIFTSTCSNYGSRKADDRATEESNLNPLSLYAETKVNVERHIMKNKNTVNFCPTILRIATAYGISDRMRFDLTIAEFTRELALDRELIVYDENTWRPYCHVADISEAILKVLESDPAKVCGEIFNVGSNEENFTKKMLADIICGILPEAKVNYKKGGYDPRDYLVSYDKISSILNFKNNHSVPVSIKKLITAIHSGMFHDVDERREFYKNY
jgi:nucleoside-diphosphate-sugar epimerase